MSASYVASAHVQGFSMAIASEEAQKRRVARETAEAAIQKALKCNVARMANHHPEALKVVNKFLKGNSNFEYNGVVIARVMKA